jgi:hypothetical protein
MEGWTWHAGPAGLDAFGSDRLGPYTERGRPLASRTAPTHVKVFERDSGAELDDAVGRGALLPVHDVELHLLTLGQ